MHNKYKHIFHIYHPLINTLYISAALVFTMFTMQPLYTALSFMCACVYSIYLNGFFKFKKTLLFALLLFVFAGVINPLFSSQGATVAVYILNKPVTKEAIFFGMSTGAMLASVIVWFSCYNALISNEKFLYLFGKPFPTAALMLSMVMRFIPLVSYRMTSIRNAQETIYIKDTKRTQKIKKGILISSILMSWTMEDCIETADSMRSRGYGVAKRTSFSVFKWSRHDSISFIVILLLISICAYFMINDNFIFYPVIQGKLFSQANLAGYLSYAVLLIYPLMLELKEVIKWRS